MLSLIIPSYNEEDNIQRTANTIRNVLEKEDIAFELYFIDDGSKDSTFQKIQREVQNDKRIHGIKFSRNFGKEACIFAGLSAVKGDCCVVIDCDLQHPPEVISKMYKLWQQGYEVVEGIKADRGKESIMHRLSAGMFYNIISKCTGIDMSRSSDFKLLDRKVIDCLNQLSERNTFFRALSFWVGFKTATVEFEVQDRLHGETKWSLGSLIHYAINNVTVFSSLPLQLVTWLGVLFVIGAIIIGIQTLIHYFCGSAVEGFTTVIILLLIGCGAIMISLGIIGHYIAKIYEEIKARPRYIISEII